MRSIALLALMFAGGVCLGFDVRASSGEPYKMWSAIVLATNEEKPKSPAAEIVPFKSKLQGIFGYNQFELIGQHTEVMDDPYEHWLIPSKRFSLHASSRKAAQSGYFVHLQLYHERK